MQTIKLTRGHPPWCSVSKKYLKSPQKTIKMGQKYKNDPKRAKNCKIGHFLSGPQSIILKIAWNDLSICILTGLGSTFWVTEKSGQKWFHGSVHIITIREASKKQEHKVSYRCSLPSPLQKRSKDYKGLHRIHVFPVPSDSVPPLLHFFFKLNPLIFFAASFLICAFIAHWS